MVTVRQTMQSINDACRSKGGKYRDYSCKVVSWDDVSRGTSGSSLSCWGANITDTYLKSKDGAELFTVRPDNWNEKLGRVSSSDVAVVAGNHIPAASALAPQTLQSFLQKLGNYGGYAGLNDDCDLSNGDLDKECSIRFQTTFLPVSGEKGSLEFASEAYNYNTRDDADPRNLVLLCTTQGVAVQQDGAGAKRLLHHAVDESHSVHRYWLEAERSKHKVGGSQRESNEERADALSRGKATASVIGTASMGTRFNVLMTIQIPLKQKKAPNSRAVCGDWLLEELEYDGPDMFEEGACALAACASDASRDEDSSEQEEERCIKKCSGAKRCSAPSGPPRGVANAARVSRGSEFDVWDGLSVSDPERHESEHVTITVVIYNTVADGVPSQEDVLAAIDDLEDLYARCGATGHLADSTFDFMKQELTAQDAAEIQSKLLQQPYKPPSVPVCGFDTFPA